VNHWAEAPIRGADALPNLSEGNSGRRAVVVSLYQLHRCVWDSVRAASVSSSNAGSHFDVGRYDLTDEERKAFEDKDVAALYRIGLHPVLLNGFARASGFTRDDYRRVLEVFGTGEERTGRWQK